MPEAGPGDMVSEVLRPFGLSPWSGTVRPLRASTREPSNYLLLCLENPMDRGAWLATVHGVAKSQT